MAVITIIKTIKTIHPESIALVKVGKFYNVYGKDSYILSYLFGYRLKEVENVSTCGFPVESLHKILNKLENKKINYLLLDRRNNYDVDEILDNKNLNAYTKTYEKAKEYINSKNRVNQINDYLLHNLNNKKIINEIEKVIEELPFVLKSCVIGIPHPYKMEVAKAFVVLKEGYEANETLRNEIYSHCVKNLAKYSLPYEIEFIDALPRTKVNKVDYRKLQEEVNEYLEEENIEEMVDILEVIRAILEHKGVTYDEIEEKRIKKANKRGGFKEKIFLEKVLQNGD